MSMTVPLLVCLSYFAVIYGGMFASDLIGDRGHREHAIRVLDVVGVLIKPFVPIAKVTFAILIFWLIQKGLGI